MERRRRRSSKWVEQPIYTQITFMFDRVKELAPQHPEWKTTQPFQAIFGEHG